MLSFKFGSSIPIATLSGHTCAEVPPAASAARRAAAGGLSGRLPPSELSARAAAAAGSGAAWAAPCARQMPPSQLLRACSAGSQAVTTWLLLRDEGCPSSGVHSIMAAGSCCWKHVGWDGGGLHSAAGAMKCASRHGGFVSPGPIQSVQLSPAAALLCCSRTCCDRQCTSPASTPHMQGTTCGMPVQQCPGYPMKQRPGPQRADSATDRQWSCLQPKPGFPPAALILPVPLLLAPHAAAVQPGPRPCQAAPTLPVQHLGAGAGAPGPEQARLQVLRAVQLQAGRREQLPGADGRQQEAAASAGQALEDWALTHGRAPGTVSNAG